MRARLHAGGEQSGHLIFLDPRNDGRRPGRGAPGAGDLISEGRPLGAVEGHGARPPGARERDPPQRSRRELPALSRGVARERNSVATAACGALERYRAQAEVHARGPDKSSSIEVADCWSPPPRPRRLSLVTHLCQRMCPSSVRSKSAVHSCLSMEGRLAERCRPGARGGPARRVILFSATCPAWRPRPSSRAPARRGRTTCRPSSRSTRKGVACRACRPRCCASRRCGAR